MATGLAGSRSQGRHGNLPPVPYICVGPPPIFHGSSIGDEFNGMLLWIHELKKFNDTKNEPRSYEGNNIIIIYVIAT